jgi:hypothetical protein
MCSAFELNYSSRSMPTIRHALYNVGPYIDYSLHAPIIFIGQLLIGGAYPTILWHGPYYSTGDIEPLLFEGSSTPAYRMVGPGRGLPPMAPYPPSPPHYYKG